MTDQANDPAADQAPGRAAKGIGGVSAGNADHAGPTGPTGHVGNADHADHLGHADHTDHAGHTHAPTTGSRSTMDAAVGDAIHEAKIAAQQAGVSIPSIQSQGRRDQDADEPRDIRRVSFAFELEGLGSAPSLITIEQALEKIPGVSATIVYPSSTAWISADEEVNPERLITVFANFGIRAHLTAASLMRRSQRLATDSNRGNRLDRNRSRMDSRRISPRVRRHAREEMLHNIRAREAGWISRGRGTAAPEKVGATGDVLFTARALITPLRFWLSLPLALLVIIVSFIPSLQFDYWQWMAAVLALPVVTWGAWPFHRAAAGGLRRGLSALDATSSLAILIAYTWSVCILVFTSAGEPGWKSHPSWFAFNHGVLSESEVFFDVACGITVLLIGGRLIARRSAQSSLVAELERLQVDPQRLVTVVRKHKTTRIPEELRIPVQEVRVNDDVIVPSGEVVPVDGVIIGGSSHIAASIIMGQDQRAVKVQDKVYAGGRNKERDIKVRVVRTGHRTRIAAVYRWVREASVTENRHNRAALRSAATLVPVAFTLAVVDFILWALISGNINAAVLTALAILAGVGPVSLALSTALATRNSVEAAARQGILVSSGETLRILDDVDTVIFNRLGTLTDGEMNVETVTADKGEDPDLILRVAGALAMESDHPASQALVRAAREARDTGSGGGQIPHWIEVGTVGVTDDGAFHGTVEIPLRGLDGTIHLRTVDAFLWRPSSMTEVRSQLSARLAAAAISGGAPLIVRWKGRDRGVITLHDQERPDAQDAIIALEDQGVETMMLSRDTYPVARRFADSLGIAHVLAGIAPGKKPQAVRAVHTRGSTVAMVGDSSVLDALRVADVGVLMEVDDPAEIRDDSDDPAADVILLRSEISSVPRLFRLARRYVRLAHSNIILAWSYNIIATVLAVAGLLHPMAATVLMLASTLVIEWQSNRARRW